MNAIMTLFPYKYNGIWVFDDENKELEREAFVSGMTEIIDVMVGKKFKNNVDVGFIMHFSSSPFPGYDVKLTRLCEEHGGNWYTWEEENMEGWLCPALFKYFQEAPEEIYVQALYVDYSQMHEDENELINDKLRDLFNEDETEAITPYNFWEKVSAWWSNLWW